MKAYKLELLILDREDLDEDEIKYLIENNKYLMVHIMTKKSCAIDNWNDDHPLNKHKTQKEAFEKMFQ